MGVTHQLAEWAATVAPIRAPRALEIAGHGVIDIASCMIAGAGNPAALAARAAAGRWGGGGVSVVGSSQTLAAPGAAFCNGTASHALDYDDNYHPAKAHATAAIVPALLALAEERGRSGAAVLDAYIVGLEVMARVGQGVNLTHYTRGWHGTLTVGTIGSAAACARLLGLDVVATRNAISVATSMAGGSKKQFGTSTKPVHAGLANQFAIMAASLAEQGLAAIEEPLDGRWGFKDLFAGDEAPGFEGALHSIGDPLAIEEFGLAVKVYPCCGSVHRSLDGVLALKAAHGIDAADVASIETTVPKVNFQNLMYDRPQNEMEMRFSMHYCLAAGIAHGGLSVDDFAAGKAEQPVIQAMLPKVKMHSHVDDPVTPDATKQNPALVRIALNDGRTFEVNVQFPKGTLQVPLERADFERKFLDCAREMKNEPRDRALSLLTDFANLERVDELMGCFRAPGE